jgi:hypothetical protein
MLARQDGGHKQIYAYVRCYIRSIRYHPPMFHPLIPPSSLPAISEFSAHVSQIASFLPPASSAPRNPPYIKLDFD